MKKKCTERKSVHITGSGHRKPPPSPLDERVAGIIGEKLISGIVREEEGDTDAGKRLKSYFKVNTLIHQLKKTIHTNNRRTKIN